MSHPCTRHSRNLRHFGGVRRHRSRGPSGGSLGRRAVPASRRGPRGVLRPGTAMRNALDSALCEIDAGRAEPSSEWKVRFGLMLGLERVLSEKPPHLASGTELRRHQVDALAGMLTELIAANEKQVDADGSNGGRARTPPRRRMTRTRRPRARRTRRRAPRTRPPDTSRARPRRASAATASATRPRRARRSPRPDSSRPRAPRAC